MSKLTHLVHVISAVLLKVNVNLLIPRLSSLCTSTYLISLEVWPVQAIAASGGYQCDPMCLLSDDMWVRLSWQVYEHIRDM